MVTFAVKNIVFSFNNIFKLRNSENDVNKNFHFCPIFIILGENTVETQVPMYVIEGQSVHMYCIFTHKSFYTLKVKLNCSC